MGAGVANMGRFLGLHARGHQTKATRAAALPDQLLNTTPVAQPTINKEEPWQAYLKSQGLEPWAINHPSLANQLRQRLFPGP